MESEEGLEDYFSSGEEEGLWTTRLKSARANVASDTELCKHCIQVVPLFLSQIHLIGPGHLIVTNMVILLVSLNLEMKVSL